jgi:hypothetical protein
MWTGFIWHRVGSNDSLLNTAVYLGGIMKCEFLDSLLQKGFALGVS